MTILVALDGQMAAKRGNAKAALRVYLERESKILARQMASVQEEMTRKLNEMFGPEHSQWCQADLCDYFFLRDAVGFDTLHEHLPEIVEDFRSQYGILSSWRTEAKTCEKLMNESQAVPEDLLSEADAEWSKFTMYLSAVEEAESHYESIHSDCDMQINLRRFSSSSSSSSSSQ